MSCPSRWLARPQARGRIAPEFAITRGETTMKFGLLYEAQRPLSGTNVDWNKLYKETLEQCVLADKMGFDNLWFVEHHFLTGFSGSPCPEVLLGALSQLTKRIRIGFGVSILPAHHPIH